MELYSLLVAVILSSATSCVLYGVYLLKHEDDLAGRLINFALIMIPLFGILFFWVACSGARKRLTQVESECRSEIHGSPDEW